MTPTPVVLEIEKRLGRYDDVGRPVMGEYERILSAIYKITQERGGPCTTREIIALTGMTRYIVYGRLLEMAEIGGMVHFESGKARTIRLAGQGGGQAYYRVPAPEEIVAVLRPTKRRLWAQVKDGKEVI